MRTYSLNATLGHSTATRLHFEADPRVPSPAARAARDESVAELVRQLEPREAMAVTNFVDGGDPLPMDVLSRLRERFTKEQMAALLGVVQPRERHMPQDTKPPETAAERPTSDPPASWRITDDVWNSISALLAQIDAKKLGGERANQRNTLNGIVNRAITGMPWQRLPREFGNHQTLRMCAMRWYYKRALRPLIAALTAACPDLEDVKWERVLGKPEAVKFVHHADDAPRRPHRSTAVRRKAARVVPARAVRSVAASNVAEAFGVQLQPSHMGRLSLGKLNVDLYFDPRPAKGVIHARHTYGKTDSITFSSAAGVKDIGAAIGNHLQALHNRRAKGDQPEG